MPREPRAFAAAQARAVLFDLDDTLYPLDRFVLSGLAAVATHLHREYRLERQASLRALVDGFRHGERGRELQGAVARLGLRPALVPALVNVMRTHRPQLRLPGASAGTLAALRPTWRLAVVTNGAPDIQSRKVEALGLAPLVDVVIYAHAVGRGEGKPAAAPFLEAAIRLGVPVARAVFVGDDPATDIAGAARVGMRTIRMAGPRARGPITPHGADATVRSLAEVPDVAEGLVERHGGVHVV